MAYRELLVAFLPEQAAFEGRRRHEASPRIDATTPRASGRTGEGDRAREGLFNGPDRASVSAKLSFVGTDLGGVAGPI